MSRSRFILILLLTVVLDLSVPMPHGSAEATEEFQEAAHAARGRRPFRLVRQSVATPVARGTAVLERHETRRRGVEFVRRTAPPPVIRKQPPAFSDSSASPDAH
jgi:hypothetical protein